MMKPTLLKLFLITFLLSMGMYGCSFSQTGKKKNENRCLAADSVAAVLPTVFMLKEITPENLVRIYEAFTG